MTAIGATQIYMFGGMVERGQVSDWDGCMHAMNQSDNI
jgi:hypothetical protein